MPTTTQAVPRRTQPELEYACSRSPELGYEPSESAGFIRCLSHGFPTPLARWHCHDEYELHLITASSGKVFVGDWIGQFQPGQLVLTGPRLPHNWISMDVPPEGVPERDLVVQFPHEPFAAACDGIPELREVMPLLERARHGIEFFGQHASAEAHWRRVKERQGLARFGAFCEWMADLARCSDYRLLSSAPLRSDDNDLELAQVDVLVSRITEQLGAPLSAADLAQEMGMTESRFSRFFRRATGNTFTDFVNRVRVNRACQLLQESDRTITLIAYEVGFNNMANFNRRFLDIKGVTPSEYRKRSAGRFGGK